jgi:hypothetical protein
MPPSPKENAHLYLRAQPHPLYLRLKLPRIYAVYSWAIVRLLIEEVIRLNPQSMFAHQALR